MLVLVQAFMALENSESGHPMAINTGTDRDLSKNWELLQAGRGGNCNSPNLPCPTARYNPTDKYYYVFGGGIDITLTRSKDLLVWERRNMSMMTHCISQDICLKYRPPCPPNASSYEQCCIPTPDCSPASGEGQIAPGYWTEYWANRSDCRNSGRPDESCRRDFLTNMSQWDWGVNDADFCDEGGSGPTRFIYAMSSQGSPKGVHDKFWGGYQMGTFPGNEMEWLSSFYPPSEAHDPPHVDGTPSNMADKMKSDDVSITSQATGPFALRSRF